MANAPLLTDLIPRRTSAYLAVLVAGVVTVLILGGLYALGIKLSALTTDGRVAAFDLDCEGSVGTWFSIIVLFLCGLASLLIRRLRRVQPGCTSRERCVWLAVSLVWFTMSLDEGASLHEGFKEMMAMVLGTRLMGDGSIFWAVPYFVALSAAGSFMLWAMRRTRPAVLCLFSAGGCYTFAVAAQLELILRDLGPWEIWLEESFELMGDLCILVALGLHARSLVFEIEFACRRISDGFQPLSALSCGQRQLLVDAR
jgi:hypothetical protein